MKRWHFPAAVVSVPRMPARAHFKTTKQAAKYQTTPDGERRCELCSHFEPPHRCERVEGMIDPEGWCRFFQVKE